MPSPIESSGCLKSDRWMVRPRCDAAPTVRRGYSLIELLIVMAILAAMAAFALPSLQGPLDKSRLRAGAREVRSAMGTARALAIREGGSLEFRYRIGGRDWQLNRVGPAPASSPLATVAPGANTVDPGATLRASGTLGSGFGHSESTIVRQGRLPEGIRFVAPRSSLTEPDDRELDNERGVSATLTSTALSANTWSRPITFRPNGRSEDATLSIRGNRDFVVDVALRGLTSSVSYTSPMRRTVGHSDAAFAPVSDDISEGGLR